MSLQALATVRESVLKARDAAVFDVERYLALQRIVDALDRARATLQRSESAPLSIDGLGLVHVCDELEAAVGAAAGVMDPPLQRRLDAIFAIFVDAVSRTTGRTRAGRRSGPEGRRAVGEGSDAVRVDAAGPSAPLPVVPRVLFGASAPPVAACGSRFVAQFVAYPEDAAAVARGLLAESQPRARVVADVGGDALAVGTVVEVALCGAGLMVEGAVRDVQRFVWTGRTTQLGFEVQVAADTVSTVLRYDVMVDGIVLARLRLPLERGTPRKQAARKIAETSFARSAFASYSSEDRQRVLDRVAAIRIAAKVDVFLDCHDLNPGEAWEPNLARAIDACDTFLLFWSDAAAQSPWVQWEWKRALNRPGLDGMQFHPLENGVRPPRELAAIHLGDPYMDLRAADRVRRATATTAKETA